MIKASLRRRESVLFCFVLGSLAVAGVLNLVVPFFDHLAQTNQEILKKEYIYKKYARLAAREDDIMSLYEKYKDIFNENSAPEEVTNDLFSRTQLAARKFGLRVEKIKPLPPEEKKHYSQALLEVELAGNFTSIFRFIEDLEGLASYVRVVSFSLWPESSPEADLRSRVVLSRTFFR